MTFNTIQRFGLTKRTGRWIVLVISFTWLILLHGEVLFHPDDYVFSGSGDGLKNYYTFVYHVKHDDSWLKFTGNNFPFGEHVCYTDGHPIVSFTMGWIPWVQNHPVGLLNLLMLLSIPFTSLVLYELLRLYRVRIGLCVIGALCINWLNPQIFRLIGHLALSYAWVIPLGLIIIFKFRNSDKRKWAFVYVCYCLFVWMIHPYLGFALGLLAGANFLVEGIYQLFKRSLKWRWILQVVAMTLLPLIIYLAFIKLTDTHQNRPLDAKGYLQYSSSLECLFVPNHEPFRNLISQLINIKQNWEGWAYIGLASILIIIIALTVYVKSFFAFLKGNKEWCFLIISASFVALFSCGFPFKQGHENWLDIIPYIEQFRAPGRFAWILYYTITVFVFVLLDQWMRRIDGSKITNGLVLFIVGGLFFAEGVVGQREVAALICESHNMYNPQFLTSNDIEQLAKLEELKQKGSIALLPIPYFHYGSDYYLFEGSQEAKRDIHTLSFHSGIPMMANVNPRVSLTESQSLIQMIAPNYFEKNIWNQVDENMQIYVVQSEGERTRDEIAFSEKFGNVFTLKDQKSEYERIKEFVFQRVQMPDSLNSGYHYYNNFDNEPGGKKSGTTIPFIVLDTIAGDSLKEYQKWIASAWLYFEDPDAQTTALTVERYKGDSVFWVGRTHVATSHYQFTDSLFVEVPFELEPGWNYRIFSKGSETDWAEISFDHLMVRPDSIPSFIIEGDLVRYNNFPMK